MCAGGMVELDVEKTFLSLFFRKNVEKIWKV